MENQEEEFLCSDCGATVTADAIICSNCGSKLEGTTDEEIFDEVEFVEISVPSDPITLSTIESLLKTNNINYFMDNNPTDPVLGYSNARFSKLMVPKDKMEIVEKVFREYEGKIVLSDIINFTGGFETDKKINADLLDRGVKSQKNPQKKIGGYLLFFSIFLIFLLPFINLPFYIFYFNKISNTFRWNSTFGSISNIVVIISILMVLYGIYIGILIWRIYPSAIIYANRFLNVYLVYSVLAFFIGMAIIPFKYLQTNNLMQSLFKILFIVTVFSIGIVVNWKIYLRKSARVKNTFTINLN